MIRFNWHKLRSAFQTRLPRDEAINRRRPWWLRVGDVYYVVGVPNVRWVLATFCKHERDAAMLTPTTAGRNTQTWSCSLLLKSPLK